MSLDKILLFPYYFTLYCRNRLYDKGVYKSMHYNIPSICVGNIAAGGTGKTPMVEYLIRMYRQNEKIAMISRGYGRKTKGFRKVEVNDDYRNVGDEPLQIKRKFPEVNVVVCASRRQAFETLSALPEQQRPSLIILDDAFQHRKVKPDYSILLTSFSHPYFSDHLLPIGRLRDLPSQVRRADMVVVTKVEEEVSPFMRDEWRGKLKLKPSTHLLFSNLYYEDLLPVFPDDCDQRYAYAKTAVLFSGIADDSMIKRDIIEKYAVKHSIKFSDHHDFRKSDLRMLVSQIKKYSTSVFITTEKDAQRLLYKDIPAVLKERLFYLPIKCEIIPYEDNMVYIEEELPALGQKQMKECINFKK